MARKSDVKLLRSPRTRVFGSHSSAISADKLLKFFLLEKALYEVEYELAYRPDWLRVPLKGTIKILFEDEGS